MDKKMKGRNITKDKRKELGIVHYKVTAKQMKQYSVI